MIHNRPSTINVILMVIARQQHDDISSPAIVIGRSRLTVYAARGPERAGSETRIDRPS